MSTTHSQPSPDMTDPLAAALPGLARVARVVSRTRRGLLAAVLTTGLLLAVAAAVAWVVGGVLLDLAAPLPVAGRIAVLAGWCATVVLAVAAFLLVPALRRPSLDVVALRIERALGGMHNRLLTVVDLARGGTPAAVAAGSRGAAASAPSLVERLLAETAERMRGFRLRMVVPWGRLGRAAGWVAAGGCALALLHATLGERLVTTLARLRQPTADIPPATWLVLTPPGDLDVLAREPFDIEARVARGTTDAVDLVLVDAAGRAARQPMTATAPDLFTARLEGLSAPVRYRLEGGGTWSRTHAVTVVPRPEILAIERRIRLPDYMRIDAPLPVDPEQRRIEAPAGARIEWLARTSAEAATGRIALAARTSAQEVVERLDERVWFEDDLPRDAVAEVPWRWTTAQAAGGLRGFTFGSDHAPLAMRTRLEPLVLPKDALERRDVSVMARLDATAPPTWLVMALEHDKGRVEFVWGDAAAAPPADKARRVAVGPLPAPGGWTRLLAPLKQAGDLAGRSVTGVAFSVDGGRIHLDRPGWVERVEETVQRAVDTPAGSIALEPVAADPADAADGETAATAQAAGSVERRWIGAVPVERPLRAALEFASVRGDANLPDPPTEIVPTVDRPPALVVHGVPPTLSLARADDVPLSGTAFDDWGLDRVGIRVGPDSGGLGPVQPLAGLGLADRPPDTQVALPEVIRAEQLGLDAGTSVAWQLVVVDTKGQTAESAVFRVVVATPPEMELARSQTPSLAEARRAAEQLARDAERTADDLAARREAALAAVPDAARDAVAEVRRDDDRAAAQRDDQPQPDAKPQEQKAQDQQSQDAKAQEQKAADARPQDAKSSEEKPQDPKADQKAASAQPQDAQADDTKQQDEKAKDDKAKDEKAKDEKLQPDGPRPSAAELAEAAAKAAREALARLDEKDRARVAEAAAAVEQQRRAADDVAKKVQAAAAEARASRLVPAEQKQRLGELADEARALADALAPEPTLADEAAMLDQIAAATQPEEVAAQARDLAAALADVERQLDQAGAAMQIAGLARDLDRRADRLDALARAEQAAPPPAAADPAAERGPTANADQPPQPAAPAPAQPQPPAPPQPEPPARPQPPAQPQPPAAAPPESVAAADPPRPAAGQREPAGAPAPGEMPADAPRSPATAEARDQIRELRQILGEAAPQRDASTDEAAAAAEAAADRAARLAEQLAAGTPEAAPPGATPRPGAAGEPAADAAQPVLGDAQVRDALAMAQRARLIEAQAAREAARAAREQALAARAESEAGQPGQPGEPGQPQASDQPGQADQASSPPAQPGVPGTEASDGGALLGAGRLESPLRGLDAAQRAAFEALPPRVRESLLEGMRQRGPEAYRATIDAYFRALGKELPR